MRFLVLPLFNKEGILMPVSTNNGFSMHFQTTQSFVPLLRTQIWFSCPFKNERWFLRRRRLQKTNVFVSNWRTKMDFVPTSIKNELWGTFQHKMNFRASFSTKWIFLPPPNEFPSICWNARWFGVETTGQILSILHSSTIGRGFRESCRSTLTLIRWRAHITSYNVDEPASKRQCN